MDKDDVFLIINRELDLPLDFGIILFCDFGNNAAINSISEGLLFDTGVNLKY
jgi:hypothetical protein